MTQNNEKKGRELYRMVFKLLYEHYPRAFRPARHGMLPLKKGIHRDLIAAHPEFPAGIIRKVVGWYTTQVLYLKCVAAGGPRVDLEGKICGDVSLAEQAEAARLRKARLDRTAPKPASHVAARLAPTSRITPRAAERK